MKRVEILKDFPAAVALPVLRLLDPVRNTLETAFGRLSVSLFVGADSDLESDLGI